VESNISTSACWRLEKRSFGVDIASHVGRRQVGDGIEWRRHNVMRPFHSPDWHQEVVQSGIEGWVRGPIDINRQDTTVGHGSADEEKTCKNRHLEYV